MPVLLHEILAKGFATPRSTYRAHLQEERHLAQAFGFEIRQIKMDNRRHLNIGALQLNEVATRYLIQKQEPASPYLYKSGG